MKIIKLGCPSEERVYRTTCRPCGTVFEFVRMEAGAVSDPREGIALVIKCPVCERDCWVTP